MNKVYTLPPITKNLIRHSRSAVQRMGWGWQDLRLPECWLMATGKGVNIYVLDTGGDILHVDLKTQVKGVFNAVDGSFDVSDEMGHGTHVSGISGAADNPIGMIGVAPDANIYIVKIFAGEGADLSDYLAGLDWVLQHEVEGPKVVNLSIGSPSSSSAEKWKLNQLYEAGITIVAAAGNSGDFYEDIDYPGRYATTIAVASSNSQSLISDFSSRGQGVDIAAPGEDIISATPNNEYQEWSGTSMASPFVAGVVALMLEFQPLLNPKTIKELLIQTATDVYAVGKDSASGYGIINPLKCLRKIIALELTEEAEQEEEPVIADCPECPKCPSAQDILKASYQADFPTFNSLYFNNCKKKLLAIAEKIGVAVDNKRYKHQVAKELFKGLHEK